MLEGDAPIVKGGSTSDRLAPIAELSWPIARCSLVGASGTMDMVLDGFVPASTGVVPNPMQADFQQFGIRFQYPDNWTLEAEDVLQGQGSVAVYSPGGGFWSVTVHDPSQKPVDLVDAVVDAMRNMYQELDAEETIETIGGREVPCCEMNFYYLDLTSTATVRVISSSRANFVVMCQAEDREFAELENVFAAMTASLVKQSGWLKE